MTRTDKASHCLARWTPLLLSLVLWGCSSTTSSIRDTTVQRERCVSLSLYELGPHASDEALASATPAVQVLRVAAPAGALPATPPPPTSSPPLRGLPGGGLGNGTPQGVLRFAPAGGALAAAPAAGEFVFLGGAFIAAGGSTVLICVTVDAAASGQATPIEIADTYYGTHFSDLVGWVQGQYPTAGSVRQPSTAPDKSKRKRLGRVYVTYTRHNDRTGLTYSGRTSMIIDLLKSHKLQALLAIAARNTNHHIEDQQPEPQEHGFSEARADEFDVGNATDYSKRYEDIAYWRIRGREQQLIDFHGGAQSDTGEPHRTHNVVRGVAKENKNGRRFHKEATEYFKEELHPYTGD
jgi:hypothetical protein